MIKSLQNGALGNFIKDNTLDGFAFEQLLAFKNITNMPGDRFAFTIRIGREIEGLGAVERVNDGADLFFGSGVDRPVHFEIFVRPNRTIFRRQVAHMSIGCQHRVSITEILVDGLGLGGRFNDDDVLWHGRLSK